MDLLSQPKIWHPNTADLQLWYGNGLQLTPVGSDWDTPMTSSLQPSHTYPIEMRDDLRYAVEEIGNLSRHRFRLSLLLH